MHDKTTLATHTTNPDLLSRTQLIAEIKALRRVLQQLRECEDRHCGLCKSCVTALYITARPRPERIASKYSGGAWRKP